MQRSLLRQYMLFVAGLAAAMAVGAFFITTQVMRSGLENLFRERLERTESVFGQYTRATRLARTGEVEVLVTSPRFLAALETQDPETVAREIPTHGLVADADIAWVRSPDGGVLYRSDSLPAALYADVFAAMQPAYDDIARVFFL
ncbi:MAG: hypothetical protein HKN12_02065 [Gemmatimonadetes bacterium]|nr:hypothetical protein [Gemmatimonadota bacterium]